MSSDVPNAPNVPELPKPESILSTEPILDNITSTVSSIGEKPDFFKNIQTVLDTYHVSVLHIAIVVFVCALWALYFIFEERIKDFGRTQVRQLLFRMQTNSENKVSTTSNASKSKLVQFLTYLEQSWLASSDPAKNVKLPDNVHLDVEFQPTRSDEEEESYSSDEEEIETKLFNKRDV